MRSKNVQTRPIEPLPARLEKKRRQLQDVIGRPVIIRQVRTQDPHFRGRLRTAEDRLVVEYQVAQAGYFWDVDLIERLLLLALAGQTDSVLRED